MQAGGALLARTQVAAVDPAARLPFAPMERALIAQSEPGRPMTTHHVLECARPLPRPALERAAEHLASSCPPLRARTVETAWRLRREVLPDDAAAARARVEVALEPGEVETSGWVERPFDLARELPFRVRQGPTPRGTSTITFTLHHSVTDGVGALALFDAYLAAAVAAAEGRPLPDVSLPAGRGGNAWGALPRAGLAFCAALVWNVARSLFRFWQRRASLLDDGDAPVRGFGLKVVHVSPARWRALKVEAEAKGCTRNDLLCARALRAADGLRRERGLPDEPLRLLGGVDLRGFFGAGAALSNWLGTLELEASTAEVRGEAFEALVHGRLATARAPVHAAVTPVLLAALGALLPARLFRRLCAWSHAPGPRHPYTLLLSHIRPAGKPCWPEALGPQALWCASTLPRNPGLGLTVTTVGEAVTVAACWPRPLVRDATVDDLLAKMFPER